MKKTTPKQIKQMIDVLDRGVALLIKGARGEYGPRIAKHSKKGLEDLRLRIVANHARLFENNPAYRNHLKKTLSKRHLDEMMAESLRLNPKKELIV